MNQGRRRSAPSEITLIFGRAHLAGAPVNTLPVDANFLYALSVASQAVRFHLT